MGKHRAAVEQNKQPVNGSATQSEPRKRSWRGKLWKWTDFGEKKLWDWLQLLGALAIPIVLAVAGFWFTAHQEAHQQDIEKQRAEAELNLEEQRAQDTALQGYLDQMSALMLEEKLRDSEEGSEARTLARARTLTVLGRLDPRRKRSVVQFLYESSLIDKGDPIVDLSNADLTSVNLRLKDLSGADLSEVDLSEANLSNAHLNDADLSNAVLRDADLPGADLSGADLTHADLSDANLSSANLNYTDLSIATLKDTDLSGAYLRGAELSGAGLLEADLSYADLSGARGVTERTLELQYVTLEGTLMPDGQKYEN